MAQKLSASRISPEPVTMDDLNSGLQKKQNKLIAGTGIQIENDTISSTVNSAEWGNITGDITQQTDLIEKLAESGGSGKADNITITKNEADELQAEGCLNQLNNTTPIKFWSGTKAEYDAIEIKDDDTLYNVDEDSSTIHSGDDEVITGIKTFDGQEKRQSITITNDLVDINTESETTSYSSIYFTDKKTSKVIGNIASATTKYNTEMLMACENPYNLTPSETIKQESLYPQLGVYSYPDGTYSSVAPEPIESSNDQNIATTSFVNKVVNKKVGNEINSNLLNYTTNRILEIPQDIKLEINNGSLTLKAGSKLRKLTGEEYIAKNDFSLDTSYYDFNQTCVIIPGSTNDGISITNLETPNISICSSGTTIPTSTTTQYHWFFKTDTKEYYWTSDNGATWARRAFAEFFPIAIAKVGAEKWSFIEQVFNGFGYIGSTVFMLPNIKFLFTSGVNDKSSYDTATIINDSVRTYSAEGSLTKGGFFLGCDFNYEDKTLAYFGLYSNDTIVSNTKPNASSVIWFNPNLGYGQGIDNEGNLSGKYYSIKCGTVSLTNSIVTDFNIYGNGVNTINTYQRAELAAMPMPSNVLIRLTVGAADSTYTAPANGWFYTCGISTSAAGYLNLYTENNGLGLMVPNIAVNVVHKLFIPAKAAQTVHLSYSNVSFDQAVQPYYGLWFIYAQGSQ